MDRVYLTILGFMLDGAGLLHVQSCIQTTWGISVNQFHFIPSDNDASALLSLAKNMVITWAADPSNGGKTLTTDQVIVVGGMQ